jgi:hypothetical protein
MQISMKITYFSKYNYKESLLSLAIFGRWKIKYNKGPFFLPFQENAISCKRQEEKR